MTTELEALRRRLATLELAQLAMQRAFEAAGQSGESQLAALNDLYNALFIAHAGLKEIAAALANGNTAAAQALTHAILLRLREYDPQAQRLPFADLPAGTHFYFGGVEFRKYKSYRAGSAPLANATRVEDGGPAWFEEDVLVTLWSDEES